MKKCLRQATQSVLALLLSSTATLGIADFSAGAEEGEAEAEENLSEGPVELSGPLSEMIESQEPILTVDETEEETLYEEDETVRVVVEVDETPGLTYATQQGVEYQQLSPDTRSSIESNAEAAQTSVQSTIDSAGIEAEYLESFTTVMTGFSAHVSYGDIETIENLPRVSSVEVVNEYEHPEPMDETDMIGSVDQVRAPEAWDVGYDGEGTVIGIIDSGIDYTHDAFTLSEGVEFAIDEDLVSELDLPGEHFTDKIPYGYNYFDQSTDIIERGSDDYITHHGTHVAGTAAANGDVEEGSVRGVAPEAQLLALKVFGNDPSLPTTYGDLYVAAMDDAVQLGVDVLNLSLGSPAGTVNPESADQLAIQRMKENGIVVSISAGNSSHMGNALVNPYAENPDTGVVGSPSVADASISVASSDNASVNANAVELNGEPISYVTAQNEPADVFSSDEEIEVVYAGYGSPEELEEAGAEGNFVVVSRGGPEEYAPFVEKAVNAQEAGAIGVAVHNNEPGHISNMATDEGITIPYIDLTQEDGLAIAEAFEEDEDLAFTFTGESLSIQSDDVSLSNFSSWGLAPNLDFKPEITAPGGSILSTIQDNSYGSMNGTSMAAPHVAGGSSLVLDYIDETFDGIEGEERAHVAKQILLNTATPFEDIGVVNSAFGLGNYYSPRAVGAGEMDLYSALTTPTLVTSPADNDEAKVALRDFENTTNFNLEIENFSDEEVTYTIDSVVQTDLAFEVGDEIYQLGYGDDLLEAAALYYDEAGEPIALDGDTTVTVQAGETATIEFSLDVSDAVVEYVAADESYGLGNPNEIFENGFFVDGFVFFEDEDGELPPVSVPFAGFNGDWTEPPILDEWMVGEEEFAGETGRRPFYNEQTPVVEILPGLGISEYLALPEIQTPAFDEPVYVYSANTSSPFEGLLTNLTFLRNARDVSFNLANEEGEALRTLYTSSTESGHFGVSGQSLVTSDLYADAVWDGTIEGEIPEDGEYVYQIEAYPQYEADEPQTTSFDFVLDSTAPTIEYEWNEEEEELSYIITDNLTGVYAAEILLDGESQGLIEVGEGEETLEGSIDIPENTSNIQLFAADYADNIAEEVVRLEDSFEHDDHVMILEDPGHLEIYNSLEVPVSGLIETNDEIVSVTALDQEIEFTFDSGDNGWFFEDTITVPEDGVYDVNVVGVTESGEEVRGNRSVAVDTTAPVIEHNAPEITTDSEIEVDFFISDNFDGVRFYINGNEILANEFDLPFEQRSFEAEYTEIFSLEEGENEITISAVDEAGNETVETIQVTYDPNTSTTSRIFGETRFHTAVQISQDGWDNADTVVLASSHEFADALAGVPLAHQLDAPILPAQSHILEPVILEELERLNPEEIVILGGESAIDSNVETQLNESGYETRRIAGETRYHTADLIADELTANNDSNEAIVASGEEFADAMSVAAYAATEGLPIYLLEQHAIHPDLVETLASYDSTVVIGGPAALSDEVVNQLQQPTRLDGETRYHTNLAVMDHFGAPTDHLYVATGDNFVDALTGSVLAAQNESAVALVPPANRLMPEFEAFIVEHGYQNYTLFGGPSAISEEIENLIAE